MVERLTILQETNNPNPMKRAPVPVGEIDVAIKGAMEIRRPESPFARGDPAYLQ